MSDINQTKSYYGTCEKISKNVTTTIPLLLEIKLRKSTKLSKYIWELKNNSINYDLKWSIASKAHPYTGGTRKRDLCLTEKLTIIKADPESLLNTRDESISKCRHMTKFI